MEESRSRCERDRGIGELGRGKYFIVKETEDGRGRGMTIGGTNKWNIKVIRKKGGQEIKMKR
jgi:hypothetical protein